MTDEELRAAKALCDAATRGPWQWCEEYGSVALRSLTVGPYQSVAIAEPCGTQNSSVLLDDADAQFIAASRSLVPRLIAEVERLRADVDARTPTVHVNGIRSQRDEALAVVERMTPVYESAKVWRDTWRHRRPFGTEEAAVALVDAVDDAEAKERAP
jgi:hypothetical protein